MDRQDDTSNKTILSEKEPETGKMGRWETRDMQRDERSRSSKEVQ